MTPARGASAAHPVEEFLQALTAQLDRAQDTLALKVRAGRPLTWALKDLAIDLRVFLEVDSAGRVLLRTAAAERGKREHRAPHAHDDHPADGRGEHAVVRGATRIRAGSTISAGRATGRGRSPEARLDGRAHGRPVEADVGRREHRRGGSDGRHARQPAARGARSGVAPARHGAGSHQERRRSAAAHLRRQPQRRRGHRGAAGRRAGRSDRRAAAGGPRASGHAPRARPGGSVRRAIAAPPATSACRPAGRWPRPWPPGASSHEGPGRPRSALAARTGADGRPRTRWSSACAPRESASTCRRTSMSVSARPPRRRGWTTGGWIARFTRSRRRRGSPGRSRRRATRSVPASGTSAGTTSRSRLGLSRTFRLEVDPDVSIVNLVSDLAALDRVEMVSPHYLCQAPFAVRAAGAARAAATTTRAR